MIEQLSLAERPRERCLHLGPEVLSLRECLAVVLGSGPRGRGCMGLAADILSQIGTRSSESEHDEAFFRAWRQAGPALLRQVHGLGPAQRARLLAVFELGRRLSQIQFESHPSPSDLNLSVLERKALQRIDSAVRAHDHEWLGFVPIFADGRVGAFWMVARGARRHVYVDRQRLFLEILLTGAPAFILVHNHPSGNLNPSRSDHDLTQEITSLAQQLELQCVSHLIVTASGATPIC